MDAGEFLQVLCLGMACVNRDALRALTPDSFQDAGMSRVVDEMQKVDAGLVKPEEATRLAELMQRHGVASLNGKRLWQAACEKLDSDSKRERARRIVAGLHIGGQTLSSADYIQKLKDLVNGL